MRFIFIDHKRRKLDTHSSPSHSSSVKVSMAWGRLCPFLLYLPERSLPLHIPAALKITMESCRNCRRDILEVPNKSMGGGENSMDISIFLWSWEKTPHGLSQVVYIEYFHIEIFIYFDINESSQCALGWRNFLKHFYIPCGFFAFLRILFTWCEMACQVKSFRLLQWQICFFHGEQCFTTCNGARDFFFPVFQAEKIYLLKWCYVSRRSPQRARIQRRVRWRPAKALNTSLQLRHRSVSCHRLLKRPACSLHVTPYMLRQPWLVQPLRHPHGYRPSASTDVLPPGNHSMDNHSHQQLRSSESWIGQKSRGNKAACSYRESEWGKEWVKPEPSGVLPKPTGSLW